MTTYTFKTRDGDTNIINISNILRSGNHTSAIYQGFTYQPTTFTNSSNGSIPGFQGMPTDMAAPNMVNYTTSVHINVPSRATHGTVMGRGGGGGSGGGGGGSRNMTRTDAWMTGGSGGSGAAASFTSERLNLGTSSENKTATITIGGGGAKGNGGNLTHGYGAPLTSGAGNNGGTGGSTNIEIKDSVGRTITSKTMNGGEGGTGGNGVTTNGPQSNFKGTGAPVANKAHYINQTSSTFEPSTIVAQHGSGATAGGAGGSGGVSAGNLAYIGRDGTAGQPGAISVIWIYGGGG